MTVEVMDANCDELVVFRKKNPLLSIQYAAVWTFLMTFVFLECVTMNISLCQNTIISAKKEILDVTKTYVNIEFQFNIMAIFLHKRVDINYLKLD